MSDERFHSEIDFENEHLSKGDVINTKIKEVIGDSVYLHNPSEICDDLIHAPKRNYGIDEDSVGKTARVRINRDCDRKGDYEPANATEHIPSYIEKPPDELPSSDWLMGKEYCVKVCEKDQTLLVKNSPYIIITEGVNKLNNIPPNKPVKIRIIDIHRKGKEAEIVYVGCDFQEKRHRGLSSVPERTREFRKKEKPDKDY